MRARNRLTLLWVSGMTPGPWGTANMGELEGRGRPYSGKPPEGIREMYLRKGFEQWRIVTVFEWFLTT